MAIAVFSYGDWSALYPQFMGSVSEQLAGLYFVQAGTLYLENTDCSPVQDIPTRTMLLYLITAHLAQLGRDGGGGLVGQIVQATEGSVTVRAAEIKGNSALAAFYAQTPYGLQYWAATGYLRQGFYQPAQPYNFEPFAYGQGYGRYGRY